MFHSTAFFRICSLVEDLHKEYTAVLAVSKAVFREVISIPLLLLFIKGGFIIAISNDLDIVR